MAAVRAGTLACAGPCCFQRCINPPTAATLLARRSLPPHHPALIAALKLWHIHKPVRLKQPETFGFFSFPVVHFPKILPAHLSHCGRFSTPLVSARRCTSTTSFDRLMTTKHADCLWRLCVGHLVCAGLVFTGLSTHAQLPPLV